MPADSTGALYDLGVKHFRAGNQGEAEELLRQLLGIEPGHAPAARLLAVLVFRAGRPMEAAALMERAAAAHASDSVFYSDWGVMLASCGRLADAVAIFRRAVELSPEVSSAHYNLGNALKDQGELWGAIESYRRAAALNPRDPDIQNNLAVALAGTGQYAEAISHFHAAVALRPSDALLRQRLAAALQALGRVDEAVSELCQAVRLAPDDASAFCNLGNALFAKGAYDEAMEALRNAVKLRPDYPAAYNSIGNCSKETARTDDALTAYSQAVAISERLRQRGTAPPVYPGMQPVDPLKAEAWIAGNRLFCLLLQPDVDGEQICREHREWNLTYARPFSAKIVPHKNDPSPERRLRIAYVSADFRNHPAGYTLLGPLREHDRDHVELYCYSDVVVPDAMTDRFRSLDHAWRDIARQTDDQVHAMIRRDQIDILVDLSLHSAGNRLLVFARKPAPIQFTFAGYPGTTGVETIDYRLTDRWLDPPGLHDSHYTEESIHLPNSFWCYDPASDEPEVNELPALKNGFVTFGCLNNFSKINEPMLRVWARVLTAMPGSRLRLLAGRGSHRDWALDILGRCGVERGRVEFLDRRRRSQYLALYHSIDVGLDTLPWNGHVTSLDAFWMGVPVITLVGKTAVGRAGLSLARNLDLPGLVADDENGFVERAVELASNQADLARLRTTLRSRLRASPLMDAAAQARGIEAAFRQAWKRWCASRPHAP